MTQLLFRLQKVFFLTFFTCAAALAQDKFGPGYYVTNTADTVHGYIEYKTKYQGGVTFRKQLSAASEHLTIDQVKAFGFPSGYTLMRVQFPAKADLPAMTVFAKVIVKGGLDLFDYDGRFFIGSDKEGHFQLAQAKTSNAAQAIKNYQTNTGIFNILFQDCPAVKEEAQKTSISKEKLVALLQSYNTCMGLPHREVRVQNPRRSNHIGFYIGESFSNLSFGKPQAFSYSSYLYNTNFNTSAQPTLGVMALLGGKAPSSMVSFQGELVYTKASFSGSWVYTSLSYDLKQTTITKLDYSRLSLLGGMRITGRSNKLNPYISLGLAGQTFLSMNSSVNQITEINSSVEEENFELSISKTSFAAWAGAGVKKRIAGNKALFLDINYEYSFISNSGTINTLAARIGILF